jgi:hypothetical protein
VIRHHLSLAEQTTLLLYRSVIAADGTLSNDIFSRYGSSGSLVAAALLMDLALRGRARMERPQSPQRRAKGDGWGFVVGSVLLFLLAMFGPPFVTVRWRVLPLAVGVLLPFVLCPLIIAILKARSSLRAGRMLLVDTSPIGDDLLDRTLQGLLRVGAGGRIKTYIRRHFTVARLLDILASLRARLEQDGCVASAGGKSSPSAVLGMLDVRRVDRSHPAFRAIGERMRRLLLSGEVPDAGAVALALLFAREGPGVVLGRRGGRALVGLYQFFAPDECPVVRRRLRAIAAGDPIIAAQAGSDLFDLLIAIRDELEEARADASSASPG